MKLKKKPDDAQTCVASRCSEKVVDAATHLVLGPIGLCGEHLKKAESDPDFAPFAAMHIPEPSGEAPPPNPAPPPAAPQVAEPVDDIAKMSQAERLGSLEQVLADDIATVRSFEIRDTEDEAFAKQELDGVMTKWNELEAERTSATRPMNEALRKINGWFKGPLSHLKTLEQVWKTKLRDRKLAADAEAARLAAEASALAQAGQLEEARTALIASATVPSSPSGVTVIDNWCFEIINEADLPREYTTPNLVAIGKVVKALKDKTKIGGVRVWNDPIVRNVIG